jgi:hypothetical protein
MDSITAAKAGRGEEGHIQYTQIHNTQYTSVFLSFFHISAAPVPSSYTGTQWNKTLKFNSDFLYDWGPCSYFLSKTSDVDTKMFICNPKFTAYISHCYIKCLTNRLNIGIVRQLGLVSQ